MEQSIVGYFSNRSGADQAFDSLTRAGIPQACISVVASDRTQGGMKRDAREMDESRGGDITPGKGAMLGTGTGLAVALGALAIPGIGPVLAAGPIAAALTSMGVGAATGGLLGALRHEGIDDEEAETYAEGLRRGGTLMVVRCSNEHADEVEDIMIECGAKDIDTEADAWRTSGGAVDEASHVRRGERSMPGSMSSRTSGSDTDEDEMEMGEDMEEPASRSASRQTAREKIERVRESIRKPQEEPMSGQKNPAKPQPTNPNRGARR